jgi:hypothetical protein
MAVTLSSKINIQLDALLQNLVNLANVSAPVSRGLITSLATGVGANQADRIWAQTLTIAASGTYNIDVAGADTTQTDVFGTKIAMARIKAIALFADAGNTNNVVLGATVTTPWVGFFAAATNSIAIRPGGSFCIVAPDATGWPAVDAANDNILITNSAAGTSVLFDIVIIGASA